MMTLLSVMGYGFLLLSGAICGVIWVYIMARMATRGVIRSLEENKKENGNVEEKKEKASQS
ncbi:MAG: hypothetical protein DRN14_00110 [Thermoplasmata archaeon]|nr:MAG: hypothetical protein DRN14_00110 [Thermoplasmata archaeon]